MFNHVEQPYIVIHDIVQISGTETDTTRLARVVACLRMVQSHKNTIFVVPVYYNLLSLIIIMIF